MGQRVWGGVAVALVTLFEPDADRAVDVEGTARHAARLVEAGVRAVVVGGTTGESDALTLDERVALVAAVKDACPGVPLVAGAGGQWSHAVREVASAVVKAGADALLVAPPRRAVDLVAFYSALFSAFGADVPVFGYHFPGVAGGEIGLDVLPSLPLAGIKDSTGDPERLLRELSTWDGAVYTGSAPLALTAGALGAAGAILAAANVAPEDCVAAFGGDAGAQLRLLSTHLQAKARFPHGLKAAVAERFGTSTATRLG
jgi:4-hydroxy-tetrahydrodipicolinate synthase